MAQLESRPYPGALRCFIIAVRSLQTWHAPDPHLQSKLQLLIRSSRRPVCMAPALDLPSPARWMHACLRIYGSRSARLYMKTSALAIAHACCSVEVWIHHAFVRGDTLLEDPDAQIRRHYNSEFNCKQRRGIETCSWICANSLQFRPSRCIGARPRGPTQEVCRHKRLFLVLSPWRASWGCAGRRCVYGL